MGLQKHLFEHQSVYASQQTQEVRPCDEHYLLQVAAKEQQHLMKQREAADGALATEVHKGKAADEALAAEVKKRKAADEAVAAEVKKREVAEAALATANKVLCTATVMTTQVVLQQHCRLCQQTEADFCME